MVFRIHATVPSPPAARILIFLRMLTLFSVHCSRRNCLLMLCARIEDVSGEQGWRAGLLHGCAS